MIKIFVSVLFFSGMTGCIKKSPSQGHTPTATGKLLAKSSTVEFGMLGKELIIHSDDKEELEQECKWLHQWSTYIHSRNSLRISDFHCGAPIQDLDDTKRKELKHPSYSYGLDHPDKFSNKLRHYVSVGRAFPEAIRDRHEQGKLRDAVCYNSALVTAGILPFTHMSRVPPPTAYFLGFQKLSFTRSRNGNNVQIDLVRPGQALGIVASRLSVEISSTNKEQGIRNATDFVRNSWSPGTVLCVDSDKAHSAKDRIDQLKKIPALAANLQIEISKRQEGEILENAGGHCLAFVTPNLILEANSGSAMNFVSWNVAAQFYAAMSEGPSNDAKKVTFHITKLDSEKVKEWAKTSALFAMGSLYQKASEILQTHHIFYESFPINSEVGKRLLTTVRPNPDIYRDRTMTVEQQDLKTFLKSSVIAGLRSLEFQNFIDVEAQDEKLSMEERFIVDTRQQNDPAYQLWSGALDLFENFSD